MGKRRDFSKDILTCVKRLYSMENVVRQWLKSGGRMNFEEVSACFELEENSRFDMPKHPLLEYNEQEKQIFYQCFGKPLEFPKKFAMNQSWSQLIGEIVNRRNLLRETIAMTKNSQFRNYQPKKNQNETNSRTGGYRSLHNRHVGKRRNNGRRASKKTKPEARVRKHSQRREKTPTR